MKACEILAIMTEAEIDAKATEAENLLIASNLFEVYHGRAGSEYSLAIDPNNHFVASNNYQWVYDMDEETEVLNFSVCSDDSDLVFSSDSPEEIANYVKQALANKRS
jgi:hypothetical protein